MKYFVVDKETTIKNRGETAVGSMAASPYCSDNSIVLTGEMHNGTQFISDGVGVPVYMEHAYNNPTLVVGHNVIFDLKYARKTWPEVWERVINNIYIWDTQQVAYLLSGQTHMYPSLDELCRELGLEVKDEKIKEYWENGVDTELIPKEELVPYLGHDLDVTERVFRYQYEFIKHFPELFNLVRVKMDDLLCTMMMEDNGMEFDLEKASEAAEICEAEVAHLTHELKDWADFHFEKDFLFNPMSNDHISLLLFGGEYKVVRDLPVLDEDHKPVVYKTGARKGQVKTRKVEVMLHTEGCTAEVPACAKKTSKGLWNVSEEVLSAVKDKREKGHSVAYDVLELRNAAKELETYYRGYSKLVWPDNKIHPSINHCSTRTGRQSCTQPNLQNVTREEE